MWALALGTPVLVVAGFGHLISLFLKSMYKKAKNKSRSESRSISPSEKVMASSGSVSLSFSSSSTTFPLHLPRAPSSFYATTVAPSVSFHMSSISLHWDHETDSSGPLYSSSMKPRVEQISRRPSVLETDNGGDRFYFELDVGGNPGAVKNWPSFVRMNDGRALLQAVLRRQDELDSDLEAGMTGSDRR